MELVTLIYTMYCIVWGEIVCNICYSFVYLCTFYYMIHTYTFITNVCVLWLILIDVLVYCSCCFLPESVGVGASGALMGMLSSWVVWIIFRW